MYYHYNKLALTIGLPFAYPPDYFDLISLDFLNVPAWWHRHYQL